MMKYEKKTDLENTDGTVQPTMSRYAAIFMKIYLLSCQTESIFVVKQVAWDD